MVMSLEVQLQLADQGLKLHVQGWMGSLHIKWQTAEAMHLGEMADLCGVQA